MTGVDFAGPIILHVRKSSHTNVFLYGYQQNLYNTSTADVIHVGCCGCCVCVVQILLISMRRFDTLWEPTMYLAKLYSELNSGFNTISGYTTSEWKFIPAHVPHIGGLWEAAV